MTSIGVQFNIRIFTVNWYPHHPAFIILFMIDCQIVYTFVLSILCRHLCWEFENQWNSDWQTHRRNYRLWWSIPIDNTFCWTDNFMGNCVQQYAATVPSWFLFWWWVLFIWSRNRNYWRKCTKSSKLGFPRFKIIIKCHLWATCTLQKASGIYIIFKNLYKHKNHLSKLINIKTKN